MRRDHRRPFDIEASEASDVTQEFWGTTRGWSADGDEVGQIGDDPTPRSLQSLKSSISAARRRPTQQTRRVDATGRIDRTRSHGMPRPIADQQLDIARHEATLGELAAGWIDEDGWPELELTPPPAPTRRNPEIRPAQSREPRVHDAFDDDDEFEVYPEDRDDEGLIPLSPVAPLASKLGLGAVDPLLARLGAIVVAGIILLPVALAARGGAHDALASAGDPVPAAVAASDNGSVVDSVARESAAASTSAAAAGTVAAAHDANVSADASDGVAATATPAPTLAAAPEQTQSESSPATTLPAADVPQSESVSTDVAVGAATVSEPADRVAPDCSLKYEAGLGDSWYRIADAAGVTPGALMDQNLAGLDTPIFPGDEICLPQGATIPAQPVVTTAPPATAAPTTAPPTTTVKPTTTTQAPPPAPASTAQVQALIREIWPDELEDRALQIAWRESNYKATAFNGSCCYGVFQINWSAHKSWLAGYGITSTNDLLDARKNITAAYAIYQRAGGWGPWGG